MKARWSLWASLVLGLSALPAAAQQPPQEQPSQQEERSQQQRSSEEGHEGGQKQEVNLDQLPKEAQQAIQSNLGGGKIEKIERVTLPDGSVNYSTTIDREGRDFKIVVTPEGKVVKKSEGAAD